MARRNASGFLDRATQGVATDVVSSQMVSTPAAKSETADLDNPVKSVPTKQSLPGTTSDSSTADNAYAVNEYSNIAGVSNGISSAREEVGHTLRVKIPSRLDYEIYQYRMAIEEATSTITTFQGIVDNALHSFIGLYPDGLQEWPEDPADSLMDLGVRLTHSTYRTLRKWRLTARGEGRKPPTNSQIVSAALSRWLRDQVLGV